LRLKDFLAKSQIPLCRKATFPDTSIAESALCRRRLFSMFICGFRLQV
jgi:hypothetical protein